MLKYLLFICPFFVFCGGADFLQDGAAEYRDVEILSQGRVRGYRAPGTDVFTFYGIPFATAPTGVDKFKAPLQPPSWDDTFEATDRRIICPQNLFVVEGLNVTMQEDCLIANVMVPETEKDNLPVLVLVHGGGFQVGYGNEMPMINLVNTKRIITVSFNYRLGIHGFLCLGNDGAPGNAGMKDQVALLRWVRTNIASFGGNPNDVTVSGCSAGGASVDLLILSKLTDGLMNKVLPESGSSVGVFAVQFDPLQNAKNFALSLNFTNVDDIDALTEFYSTLQYDKLTQENFMDRKDSSVVFAACIENNLGQERFLEDAPVNILRNQNFKILPTYVGYANLEGAWRYGLHTEWLDLINERFSDFLPADLEFEDEAEKEEIATRVKEFYFGSERATNDTLLSFINYFTDVMFVHGILRSTRLQVERGNEQMYMYEYSFARSDVPAVATNLDIQGASHCDQTVAVMDEGNEENLPPHYLAMKAMTRALWLNFIEYGNPTPPSRNDYLPTWSPMNATGSPYYSLGQIVQLSHEIPLQNRTLFWDAIYEKHYRTPKAPSAAELARNLSIILVFLSLFSMFIFK